MLLLVGPSPERAGGIATWLRLTRDGLAARAPELPVALFPTDKSGGGEGTLPRRLADGARVVARFRAVLDETRPTLVHLACGSGWGLREAGALAAVAKARGVPVVVHLHAASLFERMEGSSFERLTSEGALRIADAVVVLGELARTRLGSLGIESQVCPNGVPLPDSPLPLPGGAPRLVVVGAAEERKGLAVLAEAVQGQDVAVRWVGPLRAPEALLASARAAGIELAGPCAPDAVPAELARAHGLLLPSLREGLPYAVLEAMAAGRGVIATSVGALGAVVRDGGLLVQPGDARALREALRRWSQEPGGRERWAAGARRDVADGFTLDQALDALMRLWGPWLGTT